MKHLLYCLSLVLILSACGDKAGIKEKAFLDQSIRQFLEYDKIAQSTPRINLSGILAKMSESKLSVSNYKLSKICRDSAIYFVKNVEIIQDTYNKFAEDKDNIDTKLLHNEAIEQIQNILDAKSCADVVEIANKKQRENSFLLAIKKSDIQQTIKYINEGINVNVKNIYGTTALMLASNSENSQISDIVKVLIEKGADVNAKNINGFTALMFAVYNKNPNASSIVELLINNGANVNATDLYGSTVLMFAVSSKNPQTLDVVKLLVDNGADVNAKNEINNETALMVALENKNDGALDIVKFLIDRHANVNMKTCEHCSIASLSQITLSFPLIDASIELFNERKRLIDVSAKQTSILKLITNSEHPKKGEIIKLLKQHGAK